MDNAAATALCERIDALLPQTQCRRCGYDGCRPYARAIAHGEAAINRCPPGGEETVAVLAALLASPALRLDPACGAPGPLMVARIDEAACIGCTLCIAACPVDAIVGAAKLMHTVLADRCTGCELCVTPCPVDCIELLPARRPWTRVDADLARSRFEARARRFEKNAAKPNARPSAADLASSEDARARRQAAIGAAFVAEPAACARARRCCWR